jgi:hypothetical protein
MLTMGDPGDPIQQALDRATGGGLYPHWDNRAARRHTDNGCVVYHGTRRCDQPEAWKAWIGCPHEHIAPSGVCDKHITEVEQAEFGWRCSLCWDRGGGVVLARFIKKEKITADEHP